MYRTRSSISYDILNGINLSSNISSILAYLSYFPPPPPVIPGPPPQRSWTCAAHSFSSSCFISDDLNPPGLRQYVPLIDHNQSFFSTNKSHSSKMTDQHFPPSSLLDFFHNQLTFILSLIIFFSIVIFVIVIILLILFIQRLRQRQSTSNSHPTTNNNLELMNKKNTNQDKRLHYHLIPYRSKHQKRPTPATLRSSIDGNNIFRFFWFVF